MCTETLEKGTNAKAQGTATIAVGGVGILRPVLLNLEIKVKPTNTTV